MSIKMFYHGLFLLIVYIEIDARIFAFAEPFLPVNELVVQRQSPPSPKKERRGLKIGASQQTEKTDQTDEV